jgi:hypothetical protein
MGTRKEKRVRPYRGTDRTALSGLPLYGVLQVADTILILVTSKTDLPEASVFAMPVKLPCG